MNITIKNLEKSEIEITGELPEKEFEAHRKKAMEKIAKIIHYINIDIKFNVF